jgi:excisionase family DNA binding protein
MSKVSRNVAGTSSPSADAGNQQKRDSQANKIEVRVNGVLIDVSPELEESVHRAFKGLVLPPLAEMTTTQAAAFLDVSRPFVIKLIQHGELPCRMVGKHRRIPTAALEQYRAQMFQQARKAADEMAQRSQEEGLYDEESPKKTG